MTIKELLMLASPEQMAAVRGLFFWAFAAWGLVFLACLLLAAAVRRLERRLDKLERSWP